jgi:hypothetical protein
MSRQGTSAAERLRQQREQANANRISEIQARETIAIGNAKHIPKKTLSTFAGKIQEFKDWCVANHYPDDIVTEDKALRFLLHVKDRPRYKSGRKRGGETSTTVQLNSKPLSYKTFEGYVNAVVNLWKHQFALKRITGISQEPSRTEAMKDYLNTIQKEVVEREQESLKDRGHGTMVDRVDIKDIYAICKEFWFSEDNHYGMKELAQMLLSFACCCRGDNIRGLFLSHICDGLKSILEKARTDSLFFSCEEKWNVRLSVGGHY